jgi:predicted restriction endonuclease
MENTSPELKVHQIDRIADVDEIVLQAIKTRRGQPSFRQALLAVFNGKCVISGCRVEAVLEAAHIIPHGEETNYRVANGLLLRADIHTLFDLGFIVVATSGVVKIDNSLKDSEYNQYDGVTIFEGEMPEELKTNLSKRQKYANEVA